jgi:hypothetical protein
LLGGDNGFCLSHSSACLFQFFHGGSFHQGSEGSASGIDFALGLISGMAGCIELTLTGQIPLLQRFNPAKLIPGIAERGLSSDQSSPGFINGFLSGPSQQFVQSSLSAIGCGLQT